MNKAVMQLHRPERVKPLISPPAAASVLGAGRSGIAAAHFLLNRGYRVYLSDSRDDEMVRKDCQAVIELGAQVTLGRHDPARLADSDFIVISPGIDDRMELLQRIEIKDIPLFSEVELAYWFSPLPTVAVTGTNGKTTTASLIGGILQAAGIRCQVAGNIGRPFCRAVEELKDEIVLVTEISSFQLHTVKSFHPRIAILLNLSPDHLDRYGSVDEYYSAKFRLFENMNENDLAILNADDPEIEPRAQSTVKCPVVWFGLKNTDNSFAFVKDEAVWQRQEKGGVDRVVGFNEIKLRGLHNLENILAASCAAAACDAPVEAIMQGVKSFTGLPHRLEIVADAEGVSWVNDSKATTVESVLRALQSFSRPIVLIMGGRHKGASFKPLETELRLKARRVIALGEAAEIIARELGSSCRVELVPDLEQAVARAREAAQAGDTVLLSPGCSSFDMFTDYEHRGEVFKNIVLRMSGYGPH